MVAGCTDADARPKPTAGGDNRRTGRWWRRHSTDLATEPDHDDQRRVAGGKDHPTGSTTAATNCPTKDGEYILSHNIPSDKSV